ncbi:MAG: bifunctional sugar-1-phosphate nucleotidylyltransferase/acetyltransferase [Nanoarchaeota archaeon]
MKAVILAAGESSRTQPLTLTRPKPLLKVANKTLLEHNLENLKKIVDEVILVVGYKQDMIKEVFKDTYHGIKLTFVEQEEALGTGHALMQAKEHIAGRFLVLNGDDLYSKEDVVALSKRQNSALVFERDNPASFGVFITKDGKVTDLIEKPKDIEKGLCNIGCYCFSESIFPELEKLEKSPRGEYELTDAIKALIKNDSFSIQKINGYWLPITYAWNLLDANEKLLKDLSGDFQGEVEEYVQLNGNVQLGKNSVIKSGTYIEGDVIIGENCTIGPNAYIRGPASIGNNCKIGPSEVKACIFFDNARCDHVSYIGDSVLGDKAHIGAHTITANLRHDKTNIKSMVKGELVDTGRRKLGAIFGDNTDTGINTSFYPGRKMWPGTYTIPSEVVKRDVTEQVS